MPPIPATVIPPSKGEEEPTKNSTNDSDILKILCSMSGQTDYSPNELFLLADGRIFNNSDREYFKGILIPSNSHNGVLRAAQLKRMYLRILGFGCDILGMDWSELPVPDFNALARPNETKEAQVKALELFAAIVLFVASKLENLSAELNCLLFALSTNRRSKVMKAIQLLSSIPPNIPIIIPVHPDSEKISLVQNEQIHTPSTTTKATIPLPSSVDIEDEYRALQLLFDAISAESETLRGQLIAACQARDLVEKRAFALERRVLNLEEERGVLTSFRSKLQKELDNVILDKTRLMNDQIKESKEKLKFMERVREIHPTILEPDDIIQLIQQLSVECKNKDLTISKLQQQCEEAEISQDLLVEKERIIVEDKIQQVTQLQNKLEEALNKQVQLRDDLNLTKAEMYQLINDNEQMTLRMTQKEDEIMQLANERTTIKERLNVVKEQQETVQSLQSKALQLEEFLGESKVKIQNLELEKVSDREQLLKIDKKYNSLYHRHATACQTFYNNFRKLKKIIIARGRVIMQCNLKLKASQREIDMLHQQNLNLFDQKSRLNQKFKKLRLKFCAQKHKLLVMKLELSKAQQTNDLLATYRTDAEMMLGATTKEVAILQERLRQQHNDTNTRIMACIAEFDSCQQDLEIVKQDCSFINTENQLLKVQLAQVQDNLVQAKADVCSKDSALVELWDISNRYELVMREYRTLQDESNQLQEELQAKTNALQEMTSLGIQHQLLFENQLEASQDKLKILESELQVKLEALTSANLELCSTKVKLEESLREKDEQIGKFRDDFDNQNRENSLIKSNVKSLVEEVDTKTRALDEAHQRIFELEEKVHVTTNHSQRLNVELEEKLRDASENTARIKAELLKCRENVLELTRTIASKEAAHESISMDFAQTKQRLTLELEAIHAALGKSQDTVAKLELQVSDLPKLKESISQYESHTFTLKKRLEASLAENHKFKVAFEELLVSKEKVEEELQSFLQKSLTQSNLIQSLQVQLKQNQVKSDNLAGELQFTKAQLETHINDHDSVNYKLEKLIGDSERAKGKLVKYHETCVQKLESQKALLQEELQVAKDQLAQLHLKMNVKEKEWLNERDELSLWLERQELELKRLIAESHQRSQQVCTSVETNNVAYYLDCCAATEDMEMPETLTLRQKEAEIGRLKEGMNEMLRSIREEHDTILTVWHNLGSRFYRDSFYNSSPQ